jgi:hypothetical protein
MSNHCDGLLQVFLPFGTRLPKMPLMVKEFINFLQGATKWMIPALCDTPILSRINGSIVQLFMALAAILFEIGLSKMYV